MKKWIGSVPDKCQISGLPFNGVMYDARTPLGWANICQAMFDKYGCKLGIGNGQRYEENADGDWILVEGA